MEWEGVRGPEVRVLALASLAEVQAEMRALGVHPAGAAIMAPKGVFRLLKVRGVDPRAANIVKQEMLARGGDAALPASVAGFSLAPTDLLLAGTLSQYAELFEKLRRQPWFGLPRLAEEMARALAAASPGWRPQGRHGPPGPPAPPVPPPFPWRRGTLTFETPRLAALGDRAAAGGVTALARARTLAARGASLIRVAADAAGPFLAERGLPLPVAVDCPDPAAGLSLLDSGADLVALPAADFDAAFAQTAAAAGAGLILVHGTAASRGPGSASEVGDPLDDIARAFHRAIQRLSTAGFPAERVLLDPGLHLGRNHEQTCRILRRLRELSSLGRPLLVTPPVAGPTPASAGRAALDGLAAAVALAVVWGADLLSVPEAALETAVSAVAGATPFRHPPQTF